MEATPWETRNGVTVKRDDLYQFGKVSGGKVRTCVALATGAAGLVTAGAAASPQVNIVAHVAAQMGIPARLHIPARQHRTPEIEDAATTGATLIEHRPGRNTVVIARARNDAATQGPGWVEIPFGMECPEAVEATASQTANLPDNIRRLVVPVGSGMTLAGILHGLHRIGRTDLPVLGVIVGADPTNRLNRWAPPAWQHIEGRAGGQVTLITHPTDYHTPADRTEWWGLTLDAHYEAKAAEYVEPGDGFWIVGIRRTQHKPTLTTPDRKKPPITNPSATSNGWRTPIVATEQVPIATLTPHPENARQGDIGVIAESLQTHGQYRPIVVQQSTRRILAGNHTWQAATHLGWDTIDTVFVDVDDEEALRILVVDNRANDVASYDQTNLADLLGQLAATPSGLTGTGFTPDDYDTLLAQLRYGPADGHTLRDKFVVPPFTVLDGRQGYWRDRKTQWLNLGIRGEEGRLHLRSTVSAGALQQARGGPAQGGGSVFDPVLAEVAYRWHTPPAGKVLDPFAGGTTRAAVAGVLGLPYTGIELRAEQVEANYAQLPTLPVTQTPTWLHGDSAQLPTTTPTTGWQRQVWAEAPYDLIFTCPPYYDLEPYSHDQLDGSQIPTWPEFCDWYKDLFTKATNLLADNRFACIVVGEIRDKATGAYRNLLGLTIDTFTEIGLAYFAEYTYITPIGSLAIRTAAQYPTGRKPGKGHQNLLVFYKGNPNDIRTTWPELHGTELGDLPATPDPEAID